MIVTFLGTGTSHGIPMIGCDCAVCRSDNPHNKRLRPSVFVESGQTNLLIDATPDFRTQALRAGIGRVDAVLVTHSHADHVLGLDDMRAFTERTGQPMPLYGATQVLADIRRVFPYACTDKPAWPSLPSFELRSVEPNVPFEIGRVQILAVELPHGRSRVLGFAFGKRFAYLTDCSAVSPAVVQRLSGVTVLTLDALRHRPHPTHLTIDAAVEMAGQIGAKLTVLTHLCHEVDHATAEAALPASVRIAYDGLRIEIERKDFRYLV
jgi:phosphoribosyl 1,2-cyclic phosphate phosphodiesterase